MIAIENMRLFDEVQARTRELRGAGAADRDLRGAECHLSSPGELEPVFETMLANAVRICEAKFGSMYFCRKECVSFCCPAQRAGDLDAETTGGARLRPAIRTAGLRRVILTKQVTHIADIRTSRPTSTAIRT